jgi:hypothetical protein
VACSASRARSRSPSPLDSTYYGNVGDFLFKTGNEINADHLKQTNLDTALQNAIGQFNYQQPRDSLALEQRANAGGGLYSSVYDQNLGNLTHSYTDRRTAAQTSHDQQYQSLAAAIAALQGSIPLYEQGQADASGQRATLAAENNPALGAPAPAPAPAAPAPAPGAPAATQGKGKGKATGVGSSLLNLAGLLSKGKRR